MAAVSSRVQQQSLMKCHDCCASAPHASAESQPTSIGKKLKSLSSGKHHMLHSKALFASVHSSETSNALRPPPTAELDRYDGWAEAKLCHIASVRLDTHVPDTNQQQHDDPQNTASKSWSS